MKYEFNEKLVERFEIEGDLQLVTSSDSRMRVWITVGLLILFTILVIGGLVLSFKIGDAKPFDALLSATSPFVAMAIGYYFGKQDKGG